MTSISTWKKVLVILLFGILVTSLTFALAYVPNEAAMAEVTLVLPENTAEYTIEGVKNVSGSKPVNWMYDADANLWSIQDNPYDTSVPMLTAKVTQAGVVAFEYLIDLNADEEALNNQYINEASIAKNTKFVFTVTPSGDVSDREPKNYEIAYGQIRSSDFEQYSFDVELGDTIEFKINQNTSSNASQPGASISWYLHGLGALSPEVSEQINPEDFTVADVADIALAVGALSEDETITPTLEPTDRSGVVPEWKQENGEYRVEPNVATSNSGDATKTTYTLTFSVENKKIITLDLWYWAHGSNILDTMGMFDRVAPYFSYSVKVDGTQIDGKEGFTETTQGFDETYSIANTGKTYPAAEDRHYNELIFATEEDGSHTVTITFTSIKTQDYNLGSMGHYEFFSGFGVKNIKVKDLTYKEIKFFEYNGTLGNVYYTVAGDRKRISPDGETVQIVEGAEVTVEAVPKAFAKSSNADLALVHVYLNPKDGLMSGNTYKFTANEDKNIDFSKLFSFEEESPKPLVWGQIVDAEGEQSAFLASTKQFIEIPNSNATLRLFFADYANGTYTVKINGEPFDELLNPKDGNVTVPESLQGKKVFLWSANEIQGTYEIEVTYAVDGYRSHTSVYHTTFVAENKGQEQDGNPYSVNPYNNLLTDDSQEGAYFITQKKSGNNVYSSSLWQPVTSSDNFTMTADTKYIGFSRQTNDGFLGVGGSDVFEKSTMLTLQLSEGRSGLVSFEVKLTGQKDEMTTHAAALLCADECGINVDTEVKLKDNPATWAYPDKAGNGWTSLQDGKFSHFTSFVRLLAPGDNGTAVEFPNRFEQEKKLATVIGLEDGWFRVTVPTKGMFDAYDSGGNVVGNGEVNFTRFIFILIADVGYDATMSIRNVTFVNSSDVTIETEVSNGLGSIEHDGALGDSGEVSFGSTVKFTAETEGNKLYGWTVIQANGSSFFYPATGEDNTFSYVATQSATIKAWIAQEGTYKVYLGDMLYDSLQTALTTAETSPTNKTVVALDSFTENSDVTIPKGVTFLLPFNSAGDFTKIGGPLQEIAWESTGQYKDPVYKVTLNNVTVNGTLNVGGMFSSPGQHYQGHTSGNYSELVLNGNVTVKQGGILNVYGRVTGDGNINVESGGIVYEPFLILDFSGGTNTLAAFNANQTPFRRYAMVNIETTMTVKHGAQLIGHAVLHAMDMYVSLDQPFISYDRGVDSKGGKLGGDGKGNDTFVMLKDEASVTISYDPDKVVDNATAANGTIGIGKTTMEFSGGATFSYMLFSAMGVNIPTSGVDFAIPYNFEIQLANGDYETQTKFKLMPGSIVHVQNGASLTLNKDAYVYDGLVQSKMSGKWYPTADELKANGYYSSNANLIVDGNLILKKDITFTGVVQTNGNTGKITIEEGVTLKKKIEDGTLTAYDCNYSVFENSMRLYDKEHGADGMGTLTKVLPEGVTKTTKQLVFTATWTANTDDKWTLPGTEIKYEAANATHGEGEHKQLEIGSTKEVTDMLGSWKLDHGDSHVYDWTPTADEYGLLGKENTHTTLDRQCTELGCTEHSTKQLLFVADTLGEVVYSGTGVTADQIKGLFEELYGKDIAASFVVNGAVDVGDSHKTTITLTSDSWWSENSRKSSVTLNFEIVPFTLTEANVKGDTDGIVYNNAEQQPYSVMFNGKLLTDSDYDITYSGNKDAGTAKATITGKGNFAGTVELTFEIKPMQLVFTAADKASPEGQQHLQLTYTRTGTLYDDGNEIENNIELSLNSAFEQGKAGDKITINIGFKDGFTAPSNYSVSFVNGTYTVTDPAFKDVVFENDSVEYDGQNHKLLATGIPANAQFTYKIGEAEQGEGNKAVGSYEVTLTIKLLSEETQQTYTYEQTRTLTITPRKITVTVLSRTFTYNGETVEASYADGWYTQQGTVVAGEELLITLSGSGRDAATYPITHEVTGADMGNYEVTFEGAASFEITKAAVTVTLRAIDVVYGEALPDATETIASVTGIISEEIDITDYLTFTPSDRLVSGHNPVGTYAFAVSVNGSHVNYDFTINGTASYNVTKRTLTVTIGDQQGVYNVEGTYSFDSDLWSITSGSLASGESRSVLKVTLAKPQIDHAGSYEIKASYDNGNYDVEIVNGSYEVSKLDISDDEDTFFELNVDGDTFDPSKTYTYSGTPLALSATVYYLAAPEAEISVKVDPQEITSTGYITVTVTIEDTNYTGSKTYTVTVAGADGVTGRLQEVLDELASLCGDLTADTLTATDENFTKLKQAQSLIDSLTEDEKVSGAERLAPYTELIQSWDKAQIAEDVISTAKAIADAPLKGLMLATSLNALIAIAYVALKGGIL